MDNKPSTASRRTVLLSSSTLAVALAGCSAFPGSGSRGGPSGSPRTESSDGTRTDSNGGPRTDTSTDSGLFDGGDTTTPDPDKGRDSYGVRVRNETRLEHEVAVTVKRPFEEETHLDETVTIDQGSDHEWDSVMTKSSEYAVTVTIPLEKDVPNKEKSSANTWIQVGDENTPPARNVVGTINMYEHEVPNEGSWRIPSVYLEWPEKYQDD